MRRNIWYYITASSLISIMAANSIFAAGWKQGTGIDAGKWYYDKGDGVREKNSWQWLDGNGDGIAECYCFDADGWMYAAALTPDGYEVNENGAWTENGIVQIRAASGSTGEKDTADKQNARETDYQDTSRSYGSNRFKTGNYGAMTSSQREETEEKIAEFKRSHIKSTMSDFEKEMEIVKWLIANCDYEESDDGRYATAYSCIVGGVAQCSGYADAFLQTAKACGLEARYISSENHAWNLVKLDGDWYHIDVTWEDAGEELDSRALFFNLTDGQIREIADHETWSPTTIKANGTKYGPGVVEHYLETGIIDTSIKESTSNDLYEFRKDVKDDIGGEEIIYTNVEDTVEKVVAYVSGRIDDGCDNYEYVIRFKEKYDASKKDSGLESLELYRQIEDEAEELLDLKYADAFESRIRVSSMNHDRNSYYYVHRKANLVYPDELTVTYILHFMYNGYEVHTSGGEAKKGEQVEIDFPGSYKPDEGHNYIVNKGRAVYRGSTFTITGASTVDMEIVVSKKDEL